ncbi:MAG: TauD/TfdA family dioxygenase [Pseudomonadota bacterium]
METTPLHPRLGVELHGLDLRDVTAKSGYPGLRALFETHSALLIRNQTLTDADHMAFASLFGPIEDRKADERKEGEAFEVPRVSNETPGGVTDADDLHSLNLKSNMLWHADSTFMPAPALTNILIARVVTSEGGNTELASSRAAFADFPEDLKARLRGLRFRHHYSHSRARISPELAALPMFHKWPEQSWPAVWKNPVTGDEALYIASHAFAVEGLEEKEGQALIDDLTERATVPDYVYSHRWAPGDVLIWDQRAVLHRGTPWPPDEPRTLTSLCVTTTEADGLADMRAR